MKHPCKKCLVRSSCRSSVTCPEWDSYSGFISQALTTIAIVTGGIVMGSLLIYLNHMAIQSVPEHGYKILITLFWILCITLNTIADEYLKVNCGFILKWFLAPILTWFYIILFSTKRYFKRA